jgi:hypothetical protein
MTETYVHVCVLERYWPLTTLFPDAPGVRENQASVVPISGGTTYQQQCPFNGGHKKPV